MKRWNLVLTIVTMLSVVSMGAQAKKPATAGDHCRPVAEYAVTEINFPKIEVEAAMRLLVAGTPLQISYFAKNAKRQIGAEGVTGNLSTVLSEFADSTGISWVQKGCVILVADKPPPEDSSATDGITPAATINSSVVSEASLGVPPVQTWKIRRGQRFSDAMKEWCKRASCSDVFWETGELESDMPQSFSGTFDEAVSTAIETLASQGIPIRAVFYGGNGVVRIMGKK